MQLSCLLYTKGTKKHPQLNKIILRILRSRRKSNRLRIDEDKWAIQTIFYLYVLVTEIDDIRFIVTNQRNMIWGDWNKLQSITVINYSDKTELEKHLVEN